MNKCLLIDSVHTVEPADIKRYLRSAIARAFTVELPVNLYVGFRLLQRRQLDFREDTDFLGQLGLKRLQALVHVLKIMAQPYPKYPGRGD